MNSPTVIVELDAKALVDVLSNPAYANFIISPLFDDCRQLVTRIPRYCIRHIFQEANKCANRLARLDHLQSLDFVLYPGPPLDLLPFVEADSRGLYS